MRGVTALVNGKILTINPRNDIVEAMLLAGDTILALGTTREIRSLLPKGGEEVDLGGRTVIPGIVDSHVHLELAAAQLENAVNVQQPGCDSLEELFHRIAAAASVTPAGEWLIAVASNMFTEKVAEKRLPTREELDAVSPEHPLVFTAEVHLVVMNTLAIQQLGWTHEALLPPGATMGRHPQTGVCTGVYCEVWNRLPLIPWKEEVRMAALQRGVLRHFVAKGVTSVHELPYSMDAVRAWQQLREKQALPLRLRLFLTDRELLDIRHLFHLGMEKGFGDSWLSLGGVKLFADGNCLHANLYESVDLKYSQQELDEIVGEAHARNLQVWVHAISEEAFARSLSACQKALQKTPCPDARIRIEHSGDMIPFYSEQDKKLAHMKKLGIVPMCTPQFSHAFSTHKTPYRRYIQEGFILPYNSDATGSQPEACNPWHGIWTLVTGKNFTGAVALPEERLSPAAAIRMATLWGAWGGHEENIKGSLEPGKLADFVVLGRDPLTCDPEELRDMPVELVVIGGRRQSAAAAFR